MTLEAVVPPVMKHLFLHLYFLFFPFLYLLPCCPALDMSFVAVDPVIVAATCWFKLYEDGKIACGLLFLQADNLSIAHM